MPENKMGPKERQILEDAKESKEEGDVYQADKSTPRQTLKRLVEHKEWLRLEGQAKFSITEEGEQALQDRKEEIQDQAGIGDFA